MTSVVKEAGAVSTSARMVGLLAAAIELLTGLAIAVGFGDPASGDLALTHDLARFGGSAILAALLAGAGLFLVDADPLASKGLLLSAAVITLAGGTYVLLMTALVLHLAIGVMFAAPCVAVALGTRRTHGPLSGRLAPITTSLRLIGALLLLPLLLLLLRTAELRGPFGQATAGLLLALAAASIFAHLARSSSSPALGIATAALALLAFPDIYLVQGGLLLASALLELRAGHEPAGIQAG